MNAVHSFEEKAAASAVAALGGNKWKRNASTVEETDVEYRPEKMARTTCISPPSPGIKEPHNEKKKVLRPAPFYYYKDFSTDPDEDPLAPLTPPGRVPNFPAKMHAILSRPDLADIVAWMPHGRSWRVLKPREFEVRVIPTYFEHSKFSSFIRQANGWGFRRITQGRDRNSYYHELFLRGLPHLCKKMKRPGVSEKVAVDPDHEPDFYKISQLHPVPEKAADDESIMLHCTLQGGPKARMPVYSGPARAKNAARKVSMGSERDLQSKNNALSASVHEQAPPLPHASLAMGSLPTTPVQRAVASLALPEFESLSAAERLAIVIQRPQLQSSVAQAAALQSASAASQFAAGFAAATALSSDQLRSVLGQALGPTNQYPSSSTYPGFGRVPKSGFNPLG